MNMKYSFSISDGHSIAALFFFAFVLAGLFFVGSVQAHEPVFSLGPETIFQGGVGLE